MKARVRPFDWAWISVLMGIWAVVLAFGVLDGLRTGQATSPVTVTSASAPDAYPVVVQLRVIGARAGSRLRPGDVLLTEGNTRMAALVRRLTRSPWAHVSIYVGPLEPGDDPRCVVEAEIHTGVRAVPLSEFKGQRARIVRPLGLHETDRQCLADWLVGHIGHPYDLAHALALGLWFLNLPGPRTMVHDAKRFICSSLLVHAFLFVGHPIAANEARCVVPGDFESAAGFEVVKAAPG